jgi:predicted DNA-binding ribbon-helix-helix protein
LNIHREGIVANKLKGSESTARTSITFAQNTYKSLEKIANLKRVSIAWVVREAVESYLTTEKNVPIRDADHA